MIENVQAILLALINFIRVELRERILLFLERGLQSLKERPYTSFSASQQARAAERWMEKGKPELLNALHQRIADAFTRTTPKKVITGDELTLLDDDSLNVVMLRARLVNSVMDRARDQIVALEVRLEALRQAGAQINARAFTPGVIADGLMDTLRQLDVPPEAQILLMETYSEHGAEMLGQFYKDMNELLIANGVMPRFKYHPPQKSPRRKPEATGQGGGAGGGAGGAGGTGSGGGSGTGSGTGTGGGMDFAPPWPAIAAGAAIPADFAQLLDAKLTAMQQALEHLTGETWQPGTLRDTFALPPPISLSPEQEESIDHIEAVFLDLIRDTRISPRFRSEFNRLILPMMSLRLSDAELFKDPDNPVRRFIRQLALLGFRDKELAIREFEHISLVVGRIVSERGQEIASFKSGADALYTIARNEVKHQLEARRKTRAAEAAPAAEDESRARRAAEAHQFVLSALRSMSAGLHLPTVVQHFVLRLLAPWMMQEYQRHGEDSDEMRDCVVYASGFFDLLQPAVDEEGLKLKTQLRQQAMEQIAFQVFRSGQREKEAVFLLEGMAAYFDELNGSPDAGLVRDTARDDQTFVSYLDDLPVSRLPG